MLMVPRERFRKDPHLRAALLAVRDAYPVPVDGWSQAATAGQAKAVRTFVLGILDAELAKCPLDEDGLPVQALQE